MASQLLGIKTRFTNDVGQPLIGGQVYTFFAGTSTSQDTYSDAALTVPNTNPVILDDTGSADIFLKGIYRIRVFDASGKFIEEQDNITQSASQGDATELSLKVGTLETNFSSQSEEITTLKSDTETLGSNKYSKVATFGSPNSDVLYRAGTIYESKGAVEKQETRPFMHDFRPTVADGSAFNTDGVNLFMGAGSGNFTMKAVPDDQLPAGFDPNLQCAHNVGYGVQTLMSLTIGYKNLALGNNAGRFLKDGHGNVFVGQEAARGSINAVDSVVVGFSAGYYINAPYNTAVGNTSLYNNALGQGNVALGRRAAFSATDGNYNINIGENSGLGHLTGSYNTLVGKQVANNGITSASNNTVIGSLVTGLENVNGQVVIADGAGNKRIEINPFGAGKAKIDLVGRETTSVNLAATDGQVNAGSTMAVSNTSNSANSFAQLYLQSRVNKPGTRMVVWGDPQRLSIVQNTTEALRVESDASVQVKTAAAGATTLNSNGMIGFELVSNTQLAIKVRGNDGTTRTATLTLS